MADTISGIGNYYTDMALQSATQRNSSTTDATLGMQDFIKLLVAQLQNQDMMNPMDNTEFIAQMATFSTLTAINNMAEQGMTSYAVSLLGKDITGAEINPLTGQLETYQGTVSAVSLFDSSGPRIFIGDKSLSLQSVMSVGKLPEVKAPDTTPPEDETAPVDVTAPIPDDSDTDGGTQTKSEEGDLLL